VGSWTSLGVVGFGNGTNWSGITAIPMWLISPSRAPYRRTMTIWQVFAVTFIVSRGQRIQRIWPAYSIWDIPTDSLKKRNKEHEDWTIMNHDGLPPTSNIFTAPSRTANGHHCAAAPFIAGAFQVSTGSSILLDSPRGSPSTHKGDFDVTREESNKIERVCMIGYNKMNWYSIKWYNIT